MKKIIDWVDKFYSGCSGGAVRVSQVHDLVNDVRKEAFERAELEVRRLVPNETDNTMSAKALREAADAISAIRVANTGAAL